MRRLLIALILWLAALPAVARENHALLIGASTYPNLDERYWLKGPKNDVELVLAWLTGPAPVRFERRNIIVLADGVAGADGAPTLAEIRAAMADLTARVGSGDFVYLHFSGHGTQAPARDPDSETDGLDELFLPADIGPWSDEVATVENALVDDEIGEMIAGLRAKGADVWAVFDSCHSGTVTRGAPDEGEEVRLRFLPPGILGIPVADAPATRGASDPRATAEAPVDIAPAAPGAGGFVAFYAAQTDEKTPELRLPKGKPGRKAQGVFTFALFEVLAEYPGASYSQIGQEVLRRYATRRLADTTPMFEGDLDRIAFSGQAAARIAQWQAEPGPEGMTIPAGSLHGLADGEVLAVLASAADPVGKAIGQARVDRLDTFSARLIPVATGTGPAPADWPKRVTLRRMAATVDFTLTVALPESGSAPAAALAAAQAGLADLAGPRIRLVPPGTDTADLRMAVIPDSPRPDAIWLLPGSGVPGDLAQTPSVSTRNKTPGELAEALADSLGAMSRAINLLKLGEAYGPGDLAVEVEVQTKSRDHPALRRLDPLPVPQLIPDDEVHVLARNTGDAPVDINVLYIGADWSITHWAAERMMPGATLKQGLFRIGDSALGQERMIVVVTPAKPQSPVENLAFLAQPPLDRTRAAPREGFAAMLDEAGFGQTTRSAVALSDEGGAPAPGILQIELRTVPAR